MLIAGLSVAVAILLSRGINITEDVSIETPPSDAVEMDYGFVKDWNAEPRFFVHRYALSRPQRLSVVAKGTADSAIIRISARQHARDVHKDCQATSAACELDLVDLWANFDEPIELSVLQNRDGRAVKSEVTLRFRKATRPSLGLWDALTF